MDTRIYDSLARRSKTGEIVFRIWQPIDNSSAAPFTAHPSPRGSPTGHSLVISSDATPKDGFSADNPYFQDMSPAAFDAIEVDLRPSSRTVWIQESVIRQVKGDLAWIDRSVARDVQLKIPEPPHSRRHSSKRHGSKKLRLPTRPPTVIDEDAASVSIATEATAGSLNDLDDPETNVMDELASVFSDSVSVSTSRTPVPLDQAASRQDEGEEEAPSPWIVAHGSLDWAIHRITRILTRNPASKVHLTVIRQDELSIERSTRSAEHLEILKNSQQRGSAERQTLIEAERFAKNSMEVLFYGRIFAESCETTYTWTSKSYPFQLPWNMFHAPLPGHRIPQSWLHRLVWHGEMPFVLAEVRMADRRENRPLSHGAGRCPGGERDSSKSGQRAGRRRRRQGRYAGYSS